MKITTLIENKINDSVNLKSEHGLCLYIEKDGNHILFDTGKSNKFIENAKKLGIDIKDIDIVVISHGHHDHGGGLLAFLKENNKAKVYMKRTNLDEYYFKFMFFNAKVGIDKNMFKEYSSRINYIEDFTEILKDIYIITKIDKKHPTPEGNKYLFAKEKGEYVRDKFDHELIMVIKESGGISIFTGCSHNGTANMIETVRNTFAKEKVKALIGGFHLIRIPILNFLSASKDEIDILAKKIIDENIEKVYTGHCTGENAYKDLKTILGEKISYISTGTEIEI